MTAEEKALAELRRVGKAREANEGDERRAVAAARKLGLSWEAIGQALGRTKQNVWKKYPDLR